MNIREIKWTEWQSIGMLAVPKRRKRMTRAATTHESSREDDSWSPIYVGASIGPSPKGNPGTLGFVASAPSGHVYAVSCRHVLAKGNATLVQAPAPKDASIDPVILHVASASPLRFDGIPNLADAACAVCHVDGPRTTPPDGYGAPTRTIVDPKVGMLVQKYGRTTRYTQGTIVGATNVVTVQYSSGAAIFRDTFVVEGIDGKVFCKGGDSGSLVVDEHNNPLGMLFALALRGKLAICTPLPHVLESLAIVGLGVL